MFAPFVGVIWEWWLIGKRWSAAQLAVKQLRRSVYRLQRGPQLGCTAFDNFLRLLVEQPGLLCEKGLADFVPNILQLCPLQFGFACGANHYDFAGLDSLHNVR